LVDKSTREAQDAAVKTWNALKAECTSEKVVFEQRIKDKIIEPETSAKKKTEWLDVEEIDLDRQEPEQQTLLLLCQSLTIYSSGLPIYRGRMHE
jgi:hypothetical protein